MQTFRCQCGHKLFFGSSFCVSCHETVGMCPTCRQVTALKSLGDDTWQCTNQTCGQQVKLCRNRVDHKACNCTVAIEENDQVLCTYCRLNQVIPDLSIDGNLVKWRRLEAAKRRALYGVESNGLPIGDPSRNDFLPLKFEFKEDDPHPVSTGHASGLITINLKEADSVKREQTRVEFGEPQRTLVGHFRHELGHYYWDMLVEPAKLEAFRQLFGNEQDPTYADAQTAYYANGPKPNWQSQYISAYASMHPWEDFAESFASYLDMTSIVSTAQSFPRINANVPPDDFDAWLKVYREIGVMANEFNRDIGLLDLVPEVFNKPVIEKLRFMHDLKDIRVQSPEGSSSA
ncbi:zinc-binding metallopeptidase family protein [Bremerella sp. P1]|uniref:zinc-binding metallopeptidase family protein n=1 Tax=Bremerella sp. P1 TaxID=3026424 RepID=UPI002368DBFC|nr:putative zinc-binding metallopeptidase [Bremerella sp. P1]WDI42535.1 putative zinc-binding metallopeptidase [Bremerella sp. P1]